MEEKYREASFDGADGVVVQDRQSFFEPEPPPRLRRKVASRRFLMPRRSHPSWPDLARRGNRSAVHPSIDSGKRKAIHSHLL
jgi:hypothetical protein